MQKDIKTILEKVSSGNGTPEEQEIARYWLHQLHQDEDSELSEQELEALSADLWSDIQEKRIPEIKKRRLLWSTVAAAACLMLVCSAAFYFYRNSNSKNNTLIPSYAQDVQAGGSKAYLTLADGRKISLTDVSNGAIATQAGIKIIKTPNGQLIYTITDQKAIGKGDHYNLIETPRGGQYQLNLPDGTKVWLNAASSLKYPVDFSSKKVRKVELTGEAYFEVAKVTGKGKEGNKQEGRMPFIVVADKQKIEVLGTHFNVNAYHDEHSIRTTLLEGSVKVNDRIVLAPGEQSSFSGRELNVKAVNASDVIDWKNGEFIFNKEPLTDILRKVSRWYNVDIVYTRSEADVPTFTGSVSKFENVSVVLRMLEETSDVRFSIVGKTIRVK
ncbi:FecR family protein [Pedobacter nyackensis]|uniref:FecR family protein n=1 Tax=Pedobacter nyackensis TaxID=475255 RepID=UPI00292CDECE|nr:FecR domain-containing protein [Pedobacter nyackensis]